MIAAASAGGVLTTRLRVNASDELADTHIDDESASAGLLGLGERMIEIVRRNPLVACGVVAAVSAASAMSHAETTVTGALPWGVAQVVAVVSGFALLGPTLQLRRNHVA
jgi:hypothetical protein